MWGRLLAAIALTVAPFGNLVATAGTTGAIAGTVITASGGKPIAGARVWRVRRKL